MHKYWKSLAATCLATTIITAPLATSLHAQAVTQSTTATNVSYMAEITSAKTAIYQNAGDTKALATAGKAYTNEIFYVRKQMIVNGTTYAQITRGATDTTSPIGWVKLNALKISTFSYPKNDATAKTLNGTGIGYTRPGGLARNVLLTSLAAYKGQAFQPLSTAKVGKETWYFGVVSGINTWIKASSVDKTAATPDVKAEEVSYVASVKSAKTPIYKRAGDKKALTKAGTTYTNEIFYVYAKKMIGDVAYYELKRKKEDAAIGWVKEKSLKLQTFKYVTNSKKTFYVKNKGKGYSRPAGGTRNVIYSTLKPYKNDVFKSTAKAKVGKATWYIGKIGANSVWVKSSSITSKAPTVEKPTAPTTPDQPETIVIIEQPVSLVASITNKKAQVIQDLQAFDNKTTVASANVKKTTMITKQATVDDEIYYEFDSIGWVKASDTKAQTYTNEQNIDEVRTLKGTGRGYAQAGSSAAREAVLSTLAALANTDFTVTKTAEVDGKRWYYGKTVNDVAIWTAASNTTAKQKPKPAEPTYRDVNLQATINSGNIAIYTDVTNVDTSRNMSAAEKVQSYTIAKEAITADGDKYYQLVYNGEAIGWVETSAVTTFDVTNKKATLYLNGLGKAYSEAGGKGTVVYDTLTSYRTDGFIPLTSQTISNIVYYKGIIDNKTVWVAATSVSNPYYVENLRKVSNITQAEMEAYLLKKKGTAIKSNPLYQAIPAFLNMQEKYGINAQFMLAHAILETGWGQSEIFKYKNNGFGYQAYDSCAKTCALYFPTMNDSVGYYADAIYNKYLKEGAIYNNGTTPAGMNVKYATAKNWSANISRLMNDMKAYDADYYDKQTPSAIEPATISATYDHIIPADKPQPATFRTIEATATVKATTKIYTLPYATASRELTTAKVGDTLNIVAYHEDVKDPSATSRWFRIDYKGQQAWVQSATLSIPALAGTTKDNTVVLSEAGTPTAKTIATLKKNVHVAVLLDNKGQAITQKGTENVTYISVKLFDSGEIGWIDQSTLRTFE
ncbi:GW dipeptide domain-containing protein [Kurthia massiliensis]|uniref:GW dipeptide domain-containing protein n=1 Tax=Kurthia massiliensis TaxID=1033739 RepID=UPI000288F4D3|nr:GW dipeptide domain-containing protein [Kurthia massiliensis]